MWMRDYSHPGVCWESNTAGCKRSWTILGSVENNFLVQVRDKSTRIEILLDLVLINTEELIKDKIRCCLGCSDHALVELVISRNMGLVKRQVRTMNFRKMNFQMLKEIADEVQMASDYLPRRRIYNTHTSAFKCLSVIIKRQLLSLLKSSKMRTVPGTSTVWVEK